MADAKKGGVAPGTTPPEADAPESFETALEELESIVTRLERGELSLDDSVHAFERGTGLLRYMTGRLDEAEKKVRVLLEKDGGLVEKLVDGED